MNKSISPDLVKLENRFDIIIKIIYARYRELGVSSVWPRTLYLEHIRVFNRYFEQDGSGKYGKEAFTDAFGSVLDSIKDIGFSSSEVPVDIGCDGTPITGAHRIAACIIYDEDINIIQKDIDGPNYDYNYFRKIGLTEKWTDPAVIEYTRMYENSFLVLLYPSGKGYKKEARTLLETAGDIFCEKDITLTKTGQVRLMRQAYKSEPWLGTWKDGFAGAKRKAYYCFKNDGPVKVFVMKSDAKRLLEAKLKIRALYEVENHSIHTTDSHEETVRLAQQIFNENSLKFMNTATDKLCANYEMLIAIYKDWITTNNFDVEEFCIDGSGIMSAYGIRDARDIDYMHLGDDPIECEHIDIGNHNSELKHHPHSKDEMIINPEYHFYYDGVKYITLDVIRKMKIKRDEPKDRIDVELIDNLLAGKKDPIRLLLRRKFMQLSTKDYYIAKLRGLKMTMDMMKYKILLKLGVGN